MRKYIACILVVAVLMTSMASVAFAGKQSFDFNLRAVSKGLTGYTGTKGDDDQNYYVTITTVTPETEGATWSTAKFYSVSKTTGDVVSKALTLTPNKLSDSEEYSSTVAEGESFQLNITITTPTEYSNVYFRFKGRWNP